MPNSCFLSFLPIVAVNVRLYAEIKLLIFTNHFISRTSKSAIDLLKYFDFGRSFFHLSLFVRTRMRGNIEILMQLTRTCREQLYFGRKIVSLPSGIEPVYAKAHEVTCFWIEVDFNHTKSIGAFIRIFMGRISIHQFILFFCTKYIWSNGIHKSRSIWFHFILENVFQKRNDILRSNGLQKGYKNGKSLIVFQQKGDWILASLV